MQILVTSMISLLLHLKTWFKLLNHQRNHQFTRLSWPTTTTSSMLGQYGSETESRRSQLCLIQAHQWFTSWLKTAKMSFALKSRNSPKLAVALIRLMLMGKLMCSHIATDKGAFQEVSLKISCALQRQKTPKMVAFITDCFWQSRKPQISRKISLVESLGLVQRVM